MVSLKTALVAATISLASFASAAPAPGSLPDARAVLTPRSDVPFHPPGKKCKTSADCYRAYFCAGATPTRDGMCTYG